MSAGGVPLLEHSLLGMELFVSHFHFHFLPLLMNKDEYKNPVMVGPCGRCRYGIFVCKTFSDLTLKRKDEVLK